jgi:hypothetical protein
VHAPIDLWLHRLSIMIKMSQRRSRGEGRVNGIVHGEVVGHMATTHDDAAELHFEKLASEHALQVDVPLWSRWGSFG